MNKDENYIYDNYAKILLSKIHKYLSSGTEYYSAKQRVRHQKTIILDLLLKKPNIFEWQI